MAEDNCTNNNDNTSHKTMSPSYSHRLDDKGKNTIEAYCTRCPSLLLTPGNASYVRKKFHLPLDKGTKTKKEDKDTDGCDGTGGHDENTLLNCWKIENMYNFENIGFSNTVGTIKYLVCADCESGPIGWHDLSNGPACYLSWDEIRHSQPKDLD